MIIRKTQIFGWEINLVARNGGWVICEGEIPYSRLYRQRNAAEDAYVEAVRTMTAALTQTMPSPKSN